VVDLRAIALASPRFRLKGLAAVADNWRVGS
jgi:hypothetical protein